MVFVDSYPLTASGKVGWLHDNTKQIRLSRVNDINTSIDDCVDHLCVCPFLGPEDQTEGGDGEEAGSVMDRGT